MGILNRFKAVRAAGKADERGQSPVARRVEDAYADVILACELLDPLAAEPFLLEAERLHEQMRALLRQKDQDPAIAQIELALRDLERRIPD